MKKLPEEFKQKWVTALRSGEYKQGTSWLYTYLGDDTFEYCCLGVAACVLDIPIANMNWATLSAITHPNLTQDIIGAISQLPDDGILQSYQVRLMGMNDGEKKTFPEIADYIEQNL